MIIQFLVKNSEKRTIIQELFCEYRQKDSTTQTLPKGFERCCLKLKWGRGYQV